MEYLPVTLSFSIAIYIRIHYHYSIFSEYWAVSLLQWSLRPLQLCFPSGSDL